ncbi:WAT1-related protein At3g28050-like isoform X2 [Rosa rugosa]|uniref:WAT1-related protein At3g28050-like isoform X2 n=1 Tax=Rosa rugosa TaxID=74645 RepID=UPI002B401B05|nr:WAT1-related protein At3g28050-like isoform X2 [Rosa rugosa]
MAKIAALPIVGMVLAECAQAGLMIVSKAAMSTGMNNLIFVCYSNALAAFVLLPTSLFFHRSTERPPITFSILCWFFLLGLLGCIAQLIGYAGINYSSPTLGTAMLNLIPAFTFVLAVIFRMEKIDGRSCSTLAKTLGTIVSISGAFIVTLYKGPPLLMTASVDLLSHNQLFLPQSNWVIGGMLLGFHCVVAAAFLIIQASVLKKYPAELIIVFYYCFFVAIQSVVVLWFVERDLSAWALNPKLRLFAVLYSGVFGSAFQVGVSTWCLNRTGPVFVSMFKPLGIVVAVAIGVIFLGDTFYLGSLIGAIVIVTGFYSVIWGKANEEKMDDDAGARSLASKKQRIPLLQNIIEEI